MALVTLLAVFPYSLLLGTTVAKWIGGWPVLLSSLAFNALIVAGLTWILMPLLARLLKPWLYPESGNGGAGHDSRSRQLCPEKS